MRPGAVAEPVLFPGRTSPSVLSEPRGLSAFDEQSLIVAELAEASQEEEELRRRNQELEQQDGRQTEKVEELQRRLQELENFQNRAVTATVVVENSGAGDHDQTAASSPFFGRKGRRFLIGAALVLLLVVGVIVGATIPLTTNNDKDKGSLSIDSVMTPTQSRSPTAAPTQSRSPTAAPTAACTRLDCFAEILMQNEVLDAEALQDDSSPQFQALGWLANDDTAVLDLDSTSPVILVERYLLAVLCFASSGEGWLDQLNFLSASSVCGWNDGDDGDTGVFCNVGNVVVRLDLGKSKHQEVINLTSQFCICVPMNVTFAHSSLPFYLNRV
jgi:hypothetical protein